MNNFDYIIQSSFYDAQGRTPSRPSGRPLVIPRPSGIGSTGGGKGGTMETQQTQCQPKGGVGLINLNCSCNQYITVKDVDGVESSVKCSTHHCEADTCKTT